MKTWIPSAFAISARLTVAALLLAWVTGHAADETPSTNDGNAGCNSELTNSTCGDDYTSSDVGMAPSSLSSAPQTFGNPINLMTGNKFQKETDFVLPGAHLSFNRLFNSVNADSNVGLGQGWHHSYAVTLFDSGNGTREIVQSNGSRIRFTPDGTNEQGQPIMRGSAPNYGHVVQTDTHHEWHLPDSRTLIFQGSYLVRIDWSDQRQLSMFYRGNRLHSVTDEIGRVLKLEYHAGVSKLQGFDETRFGVLAGHLARVTLPDGGVIEYDYDNNRNLTRTRYPDGSSREYHYENAVWTNHLTGITDRTGARFATWSYDDEGRATSSEHADGVEKVTVEFPDPSVVAAGNVVNTIVTNSLGYQSSFTWQQVNPDSLPLLLSSEGAGCATCPATGFNYTYDEQGRLIEAAKNSLGNAIGQDSLTYRYDDQGRLVEIRRIDVGGNEALVERYEFADASSLVPTRTYYPSVNPNGEHIVEVERDARGLALSVTERGWAPSGTNTVEQPNDADVDGFEPIERTTTLTYDQGRLVAMDGPRTDVDDTTRFSHDRLGRLLRMELPSGEVISIEKYDALGRAVQLRRANHPGIALQFDDNGNISRVTQLNQSVEYTYNAENRLVSVTNPNGKTSTLSYDDAQRLTRVSDDLGRTVGLSFDSESQLRDRTYQGVNGTLISSLNFVFDAQGRMQSVTEEQQDHTSGNILSKTFDLGYDASGNISAASDAQTGLTRNFVFNDLGRLLQTIEPNGLSFSQEYDVHNRLSAQTDKRLNTTQYHRDDFGRVHFLVSPDTGITQFTFDEAGNRTEKRNAHGEVTRYRWDAANRLVEQQDVDGQATYLYDDINGQLIESSNPHITETYTYTPLAQLKTHTRQIDGHAFTTEYVYSSNGKLSKKILPDGQSLRYHYYESGPNTGTLRAMTKESLFGLSQSTLLGEIDLDWRDGQTSYLSHNGHRNEIEYHADGKVSSMSVTDTLRLEYEYDEYGHIVGIRQDGNAQRFDYRAGQLSEASTISGNYRYQYDVTGNRTALSAQATNDDHESSLHYAAVAQGNRLESSTDELSGEEIAYRYNAAGSPIGIGELSYKYNANQRPVEVTRNGEVIAQYRYNNFGERIKKVTYSQNQKKVTYYLYDNRTLVAEIDGDTLEYRQTVYLKHTPVVHLIGKDVFAVHTDNLGTPKLLTDNEGETVWEATHTPLGQAIISQQSIEFNLRFPGQYADAETGTHYNYQRDYDPRTGRYLTSDPVGLEGGDNTYAYANNNVLGAIDALGLSSQLAGLPGGDLLTANTVDPFTLASANSAVGNPSALTPDVADLGVTDPNQLVLDYITLDSLCDSERGHEYFAEQIERIVGGSYQSFLNMGNLLVGDEIDFVIDNPDSYELHETENARVQLELIAEFSDSSILLIPECTDSEEVSDIVTAALGNLVHASEIDALVASMDVAEDGCNRASIIDVTDLHAEVLERFQVRLATDPRVVAAERELILAQAALDEFNALHPNLNCVGRGPAATDVCGELRDLMSAVSQASEDLANALSDVYQEQVDNGMMPPHDTQAAEAAAREEILLGIVGIFIPLTATDLAIEAATLGFGRVARLFDGAADLFTSITRTNRAGIDDLVAQGSEAARRADDIKMKAYSDYPDLQSLDYADLVRIDDRLDADGLSRLNTDVNTTPGLADAIDNDPALVDTWSLVDEIAENATCSFDGTMEIHARRGRVAIQELRAGYDYVLAKDEATGTIDYKLVTAAYSNRYDKQVLITSINDATGEVQTVKSNEIHPIFAQPQTPSRVESSEGHSYAGGIVGGQWIDASNLSTGDKLLNADSSHSTVISVEIIHSSFQAYNLSVDEFHTYYVSAPHSNTAYWVHNSCYDAIKSDPQALQKLHGDLVSGEFKDAIDANPDLLKQWKKLHERPNTPDSVRQDVNTLNMMDELHRSLPLPGNTVASSRAAATLADGTTIRSTETFGNLGRGLLNDSNSQRLNIDKFENADGDAAFRINDPELYMREVRSLIDLDPELDAIITSLVSANPAREYLMPNPGLPGLHAEVRAVNDLFRQARELGQSVDNINVSTLRPSTQAEFPACNNCSSIIVDGLGTQHDVNVITGLLRDIE